MYDCVYIDVCMCVILSVCVNGHTRSCVRMPPFLWLTAFVLVCCSVNASLASLDLYISPVVEDEAEALGATGAFFTNLNPTELDFHLREVVDDMDKSGPDMNSIGNRMEPLLNGEILGLERQLFRSWSSALWSVTNRPDILIKYQIYAPDEYPVYFHSLSREYYFLDWIEHLRISPKVFYLSGPSRVGARATTSRKCSAVAMTDIEWTKEAVGREVRFMVMEKVPGLSLYEYQEQRRFTEKSAAHFGKKIMNILRILHDETNIVHGDIHMGNWMYEPVGQLVKLIDFGSARFVTSNIAPREPRSKHVLWSPWEHEGSYAQRRDDVFRTVFILAELVTGRDFLINWFKPKNSNQMIRDKLNANLFQLNPLVLIRQGEKWQNILRLARSCTQDERPNYEAIIAELESIEQ